MITASSVELRLFDFAAEQQREDHYSSFVVKPQAIGHDPFKYFSKTLQWLETYRWMTRQLFKQDRGDTLQQLIDTRFMRRVYTDLVFNWLKVQLPHEQTLLSPHRTDVFTGRVFPRSRSDLEPNDGITIGGDKEQGWHIRTFYEYSSIPLRKSGYYEKKYRNFLAIKKNLPPEITEGASFTFIIMKRENPEEKLPAIEGAVKFEETPFTWVQLQVYINDLFRNSRFDYGEDEQGPSLEEISKEAQLQAVRAIKLKP